MKQQAYENIKKMLGSSGVSHRYHTHGHLRTGIDLTGSLPFDPNRMFKSLAFVVGGQQLVIACLPVAAKLDYKKVAEASNLPRSALHLAPEDVVSDVLGCEPGGVSPLIVMPNLRAFVDRSLSDQAVVFTGTGRATETLELASEDMLRLSGAKLGDLIKY